MLLNFRKSTKIIIIQIIDFKVPRNGGMVHRPAHLATDSDHSSVVNSSYYGGGGGGRQPFNSSKLVQSAATGRHHRGGHGHGGYGHGRELDREGRAIRRADTAGMAGGRGRTYSGCSTSPDREGSPEGGRSVLSQMYSFDLPWDLPKSDDDHYLSYDLHALG